MTLPVWVQATSTGCSLNLHIQPGAKKTEIAGIHGDALKIRLAAPPVDGKANATLLAYLAKLLKLPKSAVCLKSGETSRHKRVVVETTPESLIASLALPADRS